MLSNLTHVFPQAMTLLQEANDGTATPGNPDSRLAMLKESFRRDEFGRRIIDHSQQVPYWESANLWEKVSGRIKDRQNCQIVLLENSEADLTHGLYESLKDNPIGAYPAAVVHDVVHEDGEVEFPVEEESPLAEHVYLVGSLATPLDYVRALSVASHYKEDLSAGVVTLEATYLGSSRSDKNVDKKGNYVSKALSLRALINSMKGTIDRMKVKEPHSFNSQFFAYMDGIPLAPITPCLFLTGQMVQDDGLGRIEDNRIVLDPEEVIVVAPDQGRNIAARRIADNWGLEVASADKVRINDNDVVLGFSDEEKSKLQGKRKALSYDDELGTIRTASELGIALAESGIEEFYMVGVHTKLVGNWKDNFERSRIKRLYVTDSRKTIGNWREFEGSRIRPISLVPLVRTLIQADIEGVNFWKDDRFSQMILQEKNN